MMFDKKFFKNSKWAWKKIVWKNLLSKITWLIRYIHIVVYFEDSYNIKLKDNDFKSIKNFKDLKKD